MDKSLRLLMSAPIAEARAAVTTDLAAQGFDVREGADGLEAERDPAPRGKATKRPATRLRVVFSSVPGGTAVDVSPVTGAPAVRSTVTSMRAGLSKRGLLAMGPVAGAPVDDPPGGDASVEVAGAPVDDLPGGGAPVDEAASAPLAQPTGDETGRETGHEPGRTADGNPADPFWPFDELTASPGEVVEVAHETAELAHETAEAKPPLNTLAVVALVLGALAPIGGIVTGAIALVHIRRTGERGRRMALGGVVVGSILTTVLGVSFVAAAGLLLGPIGISPEGALVPPTASASPIEAVGDAESVDFAPQVGQCFVKRGAGEIGEANLVDCGVPHAYEIYEQFPLSGDAYPGDDLVARDAVGGCRDRFADFVGTGYDQSRLELVYLSPTVKEWARGDRLVSCLLSDPDAAVTGSLRGAAR